MVLPAGSLCFSRISSLPAPAALCHLPDNPTVDRLWVSYDNARRFVLPNSNSDARPREDVCLLL